MAWWEWLVGILLFIVALGVLIGIHELGHLAAAKAFKVYCFNYSIGFGPVLISSKRSKKHETIWTLRAIPLGGFVSMYGEGAELDTDEYIPPSRSLEGVARYKRAIIVSAGVTLNFILGFVLIFCHNAFFDHISFNLYSTRNATIKDHYASAFIINADEELRISNGDALKIHTDPIARVSVGNSQTTSVFVLANDVMIEGGSTNKYALCFKNAITTTKVDPDLTTSLALYEQISASEKINKAITTYSGTKSDYFLDNVLKTAYVANHEKNPYDEEEMKQVNEYISNLTKNKENRNQVFIDEVTLYYNEALNGKSINSDAAYTVTENTQPVKIDKLTFYKTVKNENKTYSLKDSYEIKDFTLNINSSKNGWANTGIRLARNIEHYDFVKSLSVSGQEWCDANVAVFKGIGMLFTGSGQVSGLIGIAQASSQTLANFGFERYLYLWGMISCNLAIINLLPFPGLDGFTLVVTAYEGIRKKQVPAKLKGILSLIGLALLFTLMIAVLVMDITRLIP